MCVYVHWIVFLYYRISFPRQPDDVLQFSDQKSFEVLWCFPLGGWRFGWRSYGLKPVSSKSFSRIYREDFYLSIWAWNHLSSIFSSIMAAVADSDSFKSSSCLGRHHIYSLQLPPHTFVSLTVHFHVPSPSNYEPPSIASTTLTAIFQLLPRVHPANVWFCKHPSTQAHFS